MDAITGILIFVGSLSALFCEKQAFGSVCVICGIICYLFGIILAIL